MEITRDNTRTIHDSYDEYELSQLITTLSVGEKLTISVNGVVIKEYTAKYVNCHFNLGFQDKGLKIDLDKLSPSEILERSIQKHIAELAKMEAEKLAMEGKE